MAKTDISRLSDGVGLALPERLFLEAVTECCLFFRGGEVMNLFLTQHSTLTPSLSYTLLQPMYAYRGLKGLQHHQNNLTYS